MYCIIYQFYYRYKTLKYFFHIYQNKYPQLNIAFKTIFCPKTVSLNQILTIYMYTELSQYTKLQHPSKEPQHMTTNYFIDIALLNLLPNSNL